MLPSFPLRSCDDLEMNGIQASWRDLSGLVRWAAARLPFGAGGGIVGIVCSRQVGGAPQSKKSILSSKAFASFRSSVSKRSVNQP
jgi:hypothetical protein